MAGEVRSKKGAQARVEQIHAFRRELAALKSDDVFTIGDADRTRIDAHHAQLLSSLATAFDVDVTTAQRQMSWGMRVASAIGAAAMAMAVYFFFYRVWGLLATPMQVGLLVAGPIAATIATEWVQRRDSGGYFATLTATVALACFVLNLAVLGTLFNTTPRPLVLLVWAAFALLLAYGYGLRLLLAGGILLGMAYLSAQVGTWSGLYWIGMGERPEDFIVAGFVCFSVPWVIPHRRNEGFVPIYRALGLSAAFLAVIVLSNWGHSSYLPFSPRAIEIGYQLFGFAATAAAIWLGIKRDWNDVANTGMTFFGILFFTKVFDWWWDLLPRYLFFLALGLIAIGFLIVMRRLRRLGAEHPS